jgi:hypothetical protein
MTLIFQFLFFTEFQFNVDPAIFRYLSYFGIGLECVWGIYKDICISLRQPSYTIFRIVLHKFKVLIYVQIICFDMRQTNHVTHSLTNVSRWFAIHHSFDWISSYITSNAIDFYKEYHLYSVNAKLDSLGHVKDICLESSIEIWGSHASL